MLRKPLGSHGAHQAGGTQLLPAEYVATAVEARHAELFGRRVRGAVHSERHLLLGDDREQRGDAHGARRV